MRRICETPLPEGQLVLGRRVGERVTIQIGDVIGEVTVAQVQWHEGGQPKVRLSFRFPKDVVILRAEVKTRGER